MRASRSDARREPHKASLFQGTSILAASLVGLLVARILFESRPGALGWGVDYARYLSPAWHWGPWIAALALTLVAAISPTRLAVAGLFRSLAARPNASLLLAALVCGAICFVLPDLIYFTGDTALRRSAIVGVTDFDRLFPQASPLDRFFHAVLPRTLMSWTGLPVGIVLSAQGALTAVLFAVAAGRFGAGVAVAPFGPSVAGAVVVGCAALGLFTGYDKALAELSLVTLAFAVAGVGEIKQGRAGWASGLLLALAIALHRSGLALVPAWMLLWVWVPSRARALPWCRLVPALVAAGQLPLVWKVASAVDARHVAPTGVDHVLVAATEPGRLIALANLLVFLVPLLPLLPVAFVLARPARERSMAWLGWLAASWVFPMLAIHPVQGEFRDWDDFAPAAVAMSLPLAALLGRGARSSVTLTLAITAAALVPRLQLLALQHSPEPALARVEAWAVGPPVPAGPMAASALEFAAATHFRAGRVDSGRGAMAAAIAHVPWERLYLGWANAEDRAGNWPRAVELYEETGGRFANDLAPWQMLAYAALQRGDREVAARAVNELRRLAPGDPWTARAEAALRAISSATR